jgi:FkbM family methyltransferase
MALSQIDQIVIRGLNDFNPSSEQPVVLDCGANIGISVLNYKRRFPGARITAFEPDPGICRVLRGNLARNGAGDVDVVQAAVWTSSGEIAFAVHGTDGGRIDERIEHTGPRVATVDLRDYLHSPVDLLKLDIEGAEYALVHHLHGSLSHVASLVLECHIDQAALAPFGTLMVELQQAGFHLSLNTFGKWADLVRRSTVTPPYSEQYVALYGRRSGSGMPPSPSSFLPYLDLSILLELSRAQNRTRAPEFYRREVESRQSDVDTTIRLSGPFKWDGGFGWSAMLPDSAPTGDTNERPTSSNIVMLEDDRPIGPPHTEHTLIRNYGAGRFSHWKRAIYFSTSDDSNPNLNKRRYAIGVPAQRVGG